MELNELITLEKRNFLIKANGGLALPAAGFMYWLGAGIAGYYLEPGTWYMLTLFCNGFHFSAWNPSSKTNEVRCLSQVSDFKCIVSCVCIDVYVLAIGDCRRYA